MTGRGFQGDDGIQVPREYKELQGITGDTGGQALKEIRRYGYTGLQEQQE
jgi:hypothetical protein